MQKFRYIWKENLALSNCKSNTAPDLIERIYSKLLYAITDCMLLVSNLAQGIFCLFLSWYSFSLSFLLN